MVTRALPTVPLEGAAGIVNWPEARPEPPIVTWTTPLMRAQRALHLMGEELELGSRAEAERLMQTGIDHLLDLAKWLKDNPTAGRRP